MNKFLFTALSFALAISTHAQQRNALTTKDYEQAEHFLGYNTEPLVDNSSVRPNWLSDDRFWYRVLTAQGSEFILADPAKGTRDAAFDQQKLAVSLSRATGKQYQASMLPFQSFGFSTDGKAIIFQAEGKQWRCNLQTYDCTADTSHVTLMASSGSGGRRRASGNEILSPNGKLAAFIQNYNLWVRDVQSNQKKQLTTDGTKDFGYATDNADWTTSDSPILKRLPPTNRTSAR